jgi:hypothetical protein
MSTDPSQTQLEIDLACLASLYGSSPQEVAAVAVRNLLVTAAYQMGREGLPQQTLNKLLLAPSLSERLKHAVPSPDYIREDSTDTSRIILDAAKQQSKPFTSKQIAELTGISGARVGQTLTAHRWPRVSQPEGNQVSTWLPKDSVTIGMESK